MAVENTHTQASTLSSIPAGVGQNGDGIVPLPPLGVGGDEQPVDGTVGLHAAGEHLLKQLLDLRAAGGQS